MKIYYVSGFCWEDNGGWGDNASYPIMPTKNTFSTLEDAMNMLHSIQEETKEMAEGQFNVDFKWHEANKVDDNCGTLEIIYETGTIENWVIYEREVN